MAVLERAKPFVETSRRFTHIMPLREAPGVPVDKAKRTARVIIITEGLGNLRDRNFYTDQAVKSCVEIFNGRQFYIDHPSAHEEDDRPERSIRDLAGYFFDTSLGSVRDPDTGEELSACFASLRFDESASGQFALDKVATALEYQQRFPNSKDVYAGISINGGGVSHAGTIRGMSVNVVTEIQEAFSADIVTKPARGGRFLSWVQEAARAAEWKRRTAHESRTPTRTSGEKGRPIMAVVVKNKEAKKPVKETRVFKIRPDGPITAALKAFHEAEKARKPKTALKHLGEALARTQNAVAKFLEGATMTNEDEVKGLLRKMRAAMNDGGDPMTILQDVQSDLGQLEKSLSGGGAKQAEHEQAEGEGEKDPEMSRKPGFTSEGDEAEGEHENEGEASTSEGEGEKEEESAEAAEGEGEGEKEAEGESGEEEAEAESEDAAAEHEGFDDGSDAGDDAGDDDDEDGEYGMGDEEPEEEEGEGGQAMQYKCAKCGEVNQVMPPKGFKLSKMGESDRGGTSEGALKETIERLERRISNKEARYMKTNTQMAKLVRENVRLRAENQALKLVREARKLLKEAKVNPKILSATELVHNFEQRQWPYEIKRALRSMESESRLLNGGAGPTNGGAPGKRVAGDDEAASFFRESYSKRNQAQTTDDE